MDMRAAITNVQIASDIGLDHTTVSRIRSGERLPSVDVMVEIERVYAWSVGEQVNARLNGKYAEYFERVLTSRFGADAPAPASA